MLACCDLVRPKMDLKSALMLIMMLVALLLMHELPCEQIILNIIERENVKGVSLFAFRIRSPRGRS